MKKEKLNNSVPPETIVKYLLKDIDNYKKTIKELHQKVGESESYIQELESKLELKERKISLLESRIEKASEEVMSKIKEEHVYLNLKNQIAWRNERIKALTNVRNELIEKLSKYE